MIIEPHRLVGQTLVAKASAKNDYNVRVDGLVVGRIMLRAAAFGTSRWLWSITGPALVQVELPSSGEADSFEEARSAFREMFDRWLAWAVAQQDKVHWMGGSA